MKFRPTLPQTPGRGSFGGGWTQPLEDVWTQLMAEVRGLQERLKGRGLPGEVSAYQGARIFEPDLQTYTVPQPRNPSSTWTVNYVVADGQTYDIPIIFPGPGIFVGRRLEVSIFQRLKNPDRPEADLLLARSLSTTLAALGRNDDGDAVADTLLRQYRYSLLWQWYKAFMPGTGDTVVIEDPVPMINYFWNFSDAKSQRYLSSDLLSHLQLLPMSSPLTNEDGGSGLVPVDGGAFEFDAPWVVERDGQATFHFRPISAIYQFDSSVTDTAVTGLPFNDLEGGRRKQSVRVQVELHGERYETLQDAMKQGALTRPVRRDET